MSEFYGDVYGGRLRPYETEREDEKREEYKGVDREGSWDGAWQCRGGIRTWRNFLEGFLVAGVPTLGIKPAGWFEDV